MAVRVERLIPDLTPYPPSKYLVVYHPDVQLTAEEWMELSDYEKMESDALCNPGTVGFMMKPKVKIPLDASSTAAFAPIVAVAAAKLYERGTPELTICSGCPGGWCAGCVPVLPEDV